MSKKISCFYDNTYYEFEIKPNNLNVKALFAQEYNVNLSKLASYSSINEEERIAKKAVINELISQFDHNLIKKPIDLKKIGKNFTDDKKINKNLIEYIDVVFSQCTLVQSFAISAENVNKMIASIGRQKDLFGENSLDKQNELFDLAVSNSRFLEENLYKLEEKSNGMSIVPNKGKRIQVLETETRTEAEEKLANLEMTESPKILENIDEVSVEKENVKAKEFTKKIS